MLNCTITWHKGVYSHLLCQFDLLKQKYVLFKYRKDLKQSLLKSWKCNGEKMVHLFS